MKWNYESEACLLNKILKDFISVLFCHVVLWLGIGRVCVIQLLLLLYVVDDKDRGKEYMMIKGES